MMTKQLQLGKILPITFTIVWALFATHHAEAYTTFTNATLRTTPHPKPIMRSDDEAYGNSISLEGSSTLSISRESVSGIPLWRFAIDQSYWWVTPKGIVWGIGTNSSSSSLALLEASTTQDAYRVYLTMN